MKDFIKGFKDGFKEFGNNTSLIVNSALLSFVYLLGVGVTSIIAKLSKKKFLETEFSNNGSYWSKLDLKKKPKEEYLRQF